MKTILTSLIGLAMVVAVNGQEHPTEHPTGAEHPTSTAKIDKASMAKAIEHFVMHDSALKGGAFLVLDDKTGQPLSLKLDKVHKERLSSIGNDTYFACADFKTAKGKIYDIDIFMMGKTADDLKVTEIMVHKENGKARYTWAEKKGLWMMQASK